MAKLPKRNYAITSLSGKDVCYLEIAGVRYDIAQFVASWACNEIPQAQCLVALGRNAGNQRIKAQANTSSPLLQPMQLATVYFEPEGDYNPDGVTWPKGRVVLFHGYFVGASYRKSNGKTAMLINLVHWLVDLACSSAISQNSHPSNPAHLTAPAVLEQIGRTGSSEGAYVSGLTGFQTVRDNVTSDMWASIKRIFHGLANVKARAVGSRDYCSAFGDLGSAVENKRALLALKRIEGVVAVGAEAATASDLAYKYGVPLALDDAGVDVVRNSIAKAITDGLVNAYANTTFWDKLVGEICPQYGLAVVPMVETAIVIADTPSYNGAFWKLLQPDDYDSLDQNSAVERPLRVVALVGSTASQLGGGAYGERSTVFQGGCYVAGSVDVDDGVVMYAAAPQWLQALESANFDPNNAQGFTKDVPIPTAVNPGVQKQDRAVFNSSLNRLYVKYAQLLYVSNMLRGRVGSMSGRLRFDIAPGSNIKLLAKSEKFLEGNDDLASDVYANVTRVTVALNADTGQAGTSLQLSHIRLASENTSPRTSTEEHPLFGKQIHGFGRNGAPLIPAYADLEGEDS